MEEKKWRFGVVGNIVSEHTDENGNIYYGTKAFTPGTKVYISGKFWDKQRTDISVIGIKVKEIHKREFAVCPECKTAFYL